MGRAAPSRKNSRAAKLAANRATTRQAKYNALKVEAQNRGLSLLLMARAGERTRCYLDKSLAVFEKWALQEKIPCSSWTEVDKALVEYLDVLFLNGGAAEQGDKLLLALGHRNPDMGRGAPGDPYRARAAMRGFRKLARSHSRAPLPRAGLLAIVGAALHLGFTELALGLLVGWSAYLRLPSDLVRMTGASLVRPAPRAGAPFFGILLYPQEGEELGKTLVNDESIMLDTPDMKLVAPSLHALKKRTLDHEALWSFTQAEFYRKFNQCTLLAGLQTQVSPYQIRHGAASADALTKARSLPEIQERLRHSTDTATRRYKNATRYMAELHKLPPAVSEYGRHVDLHLGDLFAGKARVTPPPGCMSHGKLIQVTRSKATPSAISRGSAM